MLKTTGYLFYFSVKLNEWKPQSGIWNWQSVKKAISWHIWQPFISKPLYTQYAESFIGWATITCSWHMFRRLSTFCIFVWLSHYNDLTFFHMIHHKAGSWIVACNKSHNMMFLVIEKTAYCRFICDIDRIDVSLERLYSILLRCHQKFWYNSVISLSFVNWLIIQETTSKTYSVI